MRASSKWTVYLLLLAGAIALLVRPIPAWAQATPSAETQPTSPPNRVYERAVVTNVSTQAVEHSGAGGFIQELTVQLQGDRTVTMPYGSTFQPLSQSQLISAPESIIVSPTDPNNPESPYQFVDVYRLTGLAVLAFVFVVTVLVVAHWQGGRSVIGMALTFAAIMGLLLPAYQAGWDPLAVSLGAGVVLAAVTIYLSHGWNRSSHISFASILLVLLVTAALTYGLVDALNMTGLASEEAGFLRVITQDSLQMQGLLLGGMLLGVIGVLDDICVSQVAVVDELADANPDMPLKELVTRSLRVGRAHVASLVNTLILVYAGANLPLFLLWQYSPDPWWVTLNTELVSEEIVRSLVGTIGLMLAVPVTSLLAAASWRLLPHLFEYEPKRSTHHHSHHH